MKSIKLGLAALALLALSLSAFGQESTVKGNLAGVVTDPSGALVPDAKVILSGPTGNADAATDGSGRFIFSTLTPGMYSVKIEKSGFKGAEIKSVEVLTGKTAQLTVKLETGVTTTTIEVTADATTVDPTSNAVSANLTDAFYAAVPIQRNVASLFYTAPGVVSGGQTGTANPSIAGGSGLENQYIADGVNITNSAYGGLGVYTQNQGAVGSGINLSFIKEVDVKTSGYEPQYGQATGGVVQIITKSGGDQFHGALSGYFAPSGTRATEFFRDDVSVRQRGKRTSHEEFEASAEIGGYIPGFKNHLFFFGSVDPSRITDGVAPPPASGLAATIPHFDQHFTTFNYAGKLTFRINDKNSFEASIFGDPSKTNTTLLTAGVPPNYNVANNTGFSNWKYGTRNIVGRYNGTLSPTWLVNFSGTYNTNYFHEKPASDVFQIVDISGAQTVTLQGFGRLEQHNAHQSGWTGDTSKVVHAIGTHTFSVGYHYEQPEYTNIQNRSGGTYAIPDTNYQGSSYLPVSPVPLSGQPTDAQFQIIDVATVPGASCPLCPTWNGVTVYANQTRGQFGGSGAIRTHAKYQDGYVNDSWTINKRVTANFGARWEQQKVFGTLSKFTFTDNWSPRVGITIDPLGDRKTKLFANFGRYSYDLPLDAAIRSLSGENDLLGEAFAPVLTGGVLSIVPDQAHEINGTNGFGAPAISLASISENFIPGTKMSYENEFVVGAEHEWQGIVFSARYVDRRLQRVIEDASGTSPEGAFVHLQNFSIVNPTPKLDAWVNEQEKVITAGTPLASFPTGCDGTNTLGFVSSSNTAGPSSDANGNQFSPNSVCFLSPGAGLVGGDYGADGLPDGFVSPSRIYTAFEFEVNKSFSQNYLMRVNYRHAKLYGNYEGAFRNDNGQSDPGISSLFDFTAGQYNLLGDQFKAGYLPTDVRNVLNTFFSYTVDRSHVKGLTLGTSIRITSGTPLSTFADHPVYQNSGEVPIGGRGALGRSPVIGNVDFKMDYPVKLGERFTLRLGTSLFNIVDARHALRIDQARDRSGLPAGSNQDFQKAIIFQDPFQARFTARIEF